MNNSWLILILLSMALATIAAAGSIENRDSDEYEYRITFPSGQQGRGTVLGGAEEYFDCEFGCDLTLIPSGQTVAVQSDAKVVIENGVMNVMNVAP
jgi:hypothetical protein